MTPEPRSPIPTRSGGTGNAPPPERRDKPGTRVMKARKSSRVSCGHYVLRGQLIVSRGHGWTCWPCALAAIRAATTATGAKRP